MSMSFVVKRAFFLLSFAVFLSAVGAAEKGPSREADKSVIKALMKKLERDTQMFEDALEIGDMEELNRLAQEIGHTCTQVCTVVVDGLTEPEEIRFKERAKDFYSGVQDLMVFTQQSTLPMVASCYEEVVRKSCRACHDLFRK